MSCVSSIFVANFKNHITMKSLKDFFETELFDANAYKAYLREIKAEKFVISYNLLKNNKILRTRIHKEGKVFETFNDLKYPPEESARTDRASVEGKPMFYGSIFTHQSGEIFLPRVINLMETSDFFKDTKSMGGQFLTQSAWGNNRDLKLALLPTSLSYKTPCDELIRMQKEYKTLAKKLGVDENRDAIYLGDMLAKENMGNTYKITAYFVDYLLNESDDKDYFDGIVYPSVPSEGLGLNICIRKELIDSGEVECDGACFEVLIKKQMQSKLSQIFDAEILPTGKLEWRNSKMFSEAIENPYLFPEMFSI